MELTEITENVFEGASNGDGTINGVCLFGTRKSQNKRIYEDSAIDDLARLADGVKCFINHPSKSELKERDGVRDLRDWLGVFESTHRDGEKVLGNLQVREAYRDLVNDLIALQPTAVGMSINARVKSGTRQDGMESIVNVDALRSVDLVSNAATTRSLFESALTANKDEDLADVASRLF